MLLNDLKNNEIVEILNLFIYKGILVVKSLNYLISIHSFYASSIKDLD